MNIEFLFYLNDAFALLKDPLQYIVAKPHTGKKASWRFLHFPRFGRESVLECLKRNAIVPTKEALRRIRNELPSDDEVKAAERQAIRERLKAG